MKKIDEFLVEQGNKLLSEGKLREAIVWFKQATEENKYNWQAYWGIAKIAREINDIEMVDQSCHVVQLLNPEFAEARELPKHVRGYYAQFAQDLIAETFFLHQPPRKKVFIDVGSFDGYTYSNIRRLYETYGWTGVCIEPVSYNFKKLSTLYFNSPVQCVQAAVSNSKGVLELNVGISPDNPLWGSDIATLHESEIDRWKNNNIVWKKESVIVRTLDDILNDLHIDDFDFLSVDTEGNDLNVIKGLDFTRYRPQLIVIEYGKDRVEILDYLRSYGYSLLLDNNLDLFLADINHTVDSSITQLHHTINFTGLSGTSPVDELRKDVEENLAKYIKNPITYGSTIVIVGLSTDWFPIELINKYPHAEIYIFEPDRSIFNRWIGFSQQTPNIHMSPLGICDEEGFSSFYTGSLDGYGSLLQIKKNNDRMTWLPENLHMINNYPIQTTKLDHIEAIKGREIDLLYINAQGTELKALQGAKTTLEKTKSLLIQVATSKTTYEGQDLFTNLRSFLLEQGFYMHSIGLSLDGNGRGYSYWLRIPQSISI